MYISPSGYILKGENAMNWDVFLSVWEDYLAFMDRVVQWLKYVFTGEGTWPPTDYPGIDDKKEA